MRDRKSWTVPLAPGSACEMSVSRPAEGVDVVPARGVVSAMVDTECADRECSDSVVGDDRRVSSVSSASARGASWGNSDVGDATFGV